MLDLISLGGLFIVPDRLGVHEAPPDGLSTWTPGKKLVGFSRGKRFLTNGESDSTFAGCSWIQRWDDRDGYVLIKFRQLPNFAFLSSQVDAVFVGPPEISGLDAHPSEAAIPKGAMPDGMREPFPQRDGRVRTFALPKDDLLRAVSRQFPIAFSLIDDYGCRTPRFHPLRPLTRSEWRSLGFHIFTDEDETTANVVKFGQTDSISFPCSTVDGLTAFGVTGTPCKAIDGDRVHLVLSQFEIVDPAQAALVFPPARVMNKKDVVIHGSINSSWFIDLKDCDALGGLPKTVCVVARGHIALPKLAGITPNGSRPLRVLYRDIRSEETECLLVTPALLESSLVSARKAVARYVIPKEIQCYTVFVDGAKQKDRYYLLSDLTQLAQPVSKKATLKQREASLIEQFGDFLPQGWQRMSDDEVGQRAQWRKLREIDGWRGANALADGMGIADGDSFGNWLQSIDWPSSSYPIAGETLYAPITWNEVIEHAEFATLFMEVVGRHNSFVQRTMFDENARAKVFAKVLAS